MNLATVFFLAFGASAGGVLMLFPLVSLWLMLVMAMVVNGPVTYFLPQYATIRWGIVLVSIALLLRALPGTASLLVSRQRGERLPFFTGYFLVLFFVVLLATAASLRFGEMVVSAKNFFQFWSVPLAFCCLVRKKEAAQTLMRGLLLVAAVAVAVALVQKFLVVGNRMFAGDSITGTFGGQMNGGGPNAAFAFFLIAQVATLLALASRKVLGWRLAGPASLALLVPVLYTNSKMIVLCLPLVFLLLFGRELGRRPLFGLAALFCCVLLTAGILLFYYKDYSLYGGTRDRSLTGYLQESLAYNLGGGRKGQLTRLGAIGFWFQEHALVSDPWHFLFGHGLGATKDSGTVLGHVLTRPRYQGLRLGMTALPRLLWDLGLVGTTAFVGFLVRAFFLARSLKRHPALSPAQQGYMEGGQVAVLLFLLSLPYQLSIINTQAFNAFVMFVTGYIAFWERASRRQEPAVAAGTEQTA